MSLTSSPSLVNVSRYRKVRVVVVVWMTIVIVGAFLYPVPRFNILLHTIRNLYFHVPMWFAMMAITLVSAYHSLRYLQSGDLVRDIRARESARVAILYGVLGLITGSMWGHVTWYIESGQWWNFDPRQSFAAIQVMIYAAYFVLRSAIDEPEKQGRIAAVYNLFAVVTVPFLLYVLPRQAESLHPGAEGNPAFQDIAPEMRFIFYPAVIGFIGLFWVLYTQRVRTALLEERIAERDFHADDL